MSAGNGDAGINSTRNYPQHQPTSKVLRPSSSNMTQPRTATRPKEAGDSSVPPSTCPRTSDPGTMRRPEAEPNGAGLRSSTDADTPGKQRFRLQLCFLGPLHIAGAAWHAVVLRDGRLPCLPQHLDPPTDLLASPSLRSITMSLLTMFGRSNIEARRCCVPSPFEASDAEGRLRKAHGHHEELQDNEEGNYPKPSVGSFGCCCRPCAVLVRLALFYNAPAVEQR